MTGSTGAVRVGVDLGQGGCRAVACEGTRTGHASTPGFWGADTDVLVADAVTAALADLGPDRDAPVRVGVGMTGLNGQSPPTEPLRRRLRAAGLRGTLRIADDSVTAYLGALGPVPGAVVAAGTGVVVLAVGADGRTARADGWGALLGDRGSGHWIGQAAIHRALRDADRGTPGPLGDAVSAAWGPVATLPARWRESPPTPERVAGFAVMVAELARAGDPAARQIWRTAGRLLAESTVGALRRAGLADAEVPVAGTGGLFRATDLLLPSFARVLRAGAPNARPVPATGDPLAGALALAGPATGPPALTGLTTHVHIEERAEHR
ncbi:BadF/BadG/BcrA/BcrD ATPase family protein [Micromonospora rubida]|uniref:BadF/BadG/BcrA/BcrD ATPase family protein n=1 Tax=Micromonospora rubida TaxID=2697657 RepID=A0ABW7SLT1_9ACTN